MLAYRVVIEENGLSDIQNAIDYYDLQQTGLGNRFFNVLQKHIELISKNPFFKEIYKDYRGLPVKTFPYVIIYFILEEAKTVYISAVFHTSQNPEKMPE